MKNNNSVAYVDKITSIIPINDADNIELATIEGWTSIITKNTFKVGEKVAVFIDNAVIPEDLAIYLNIKKYLKKDNIVHTIKLKGVYSEVIIVPLSKLDEYEQDSHKSERYFSDITSYKVKESLEKLLNISKYEKPILDKNQLFKSLPAKSNKYFDKYYKFPLLKNDIKRFTGKDCVEVTRKIHGTNARYGICRKSKLSKWIKLKKLLHLATIKDEYEFVFGSHNVQLQNSNNIWGIIKYKYNLENKLFKYVKTIIKNKSDLVRISNLNSFIIYGEIYGKDIQGSFNYGLEDQQIAFFDIQINDNYLPLSTTRSIISLLDLKSVPLLYLGKYNKPKIEAFVYNNFIPNTTIPEEGVVIKACDGNRLKTAKIKNPDFLIYIENNNIPDSH